MQKVHWTQLQSNPFLQGIHPLMLTDGGYKVVKYDRIIGMSRHVERLELEVTFDRDYLMQYFERTIFRRLQVDNWGQVQSILGEAYKRFKENQKK